MTSTMTQVIVQIVNEGDKPFSMKYGPRDRLTLEPGQRIFQPEEVAWHFLGRWWTDNSNPRSRDRQEEVNRLRTLYGAYEDDVLWEQNRPHLAVYTAEGVRVTTVVDDPDGTQGKQDLGITGEATQFQWMQEQIDRLMAQMASMKTQAEAEGVTIENPAAPSPLPVPSSGAPLPRVPGSVDVGGVPVPVVPATFAMDDSETSARLPVETGIAYMPDTTDATDDVLVDDPQRVNVGQSVRGRR